VDLDPLTWSLLLFGVTINAAARLLRALPAPRGCSGSWWASLLGARLVCLWYAWAEADQLLDVFGALHALDQLGACLVMVSFGTFVGITVLAVPRVMVGGDIDADEGRVACEGGWHASRSASAVLLWVGGGCLGDGGNLSLDAFFDGLVDGASGLVMAGGPAACLVGVGACWMGPCRRGDLERRPRSSCGGGGVGLGVVLDGMLGCVLLVMAVGLVVVSGAGHALGLGVLGAACPAVCLVALLPLGSCGSGPGSRTLAHCTSPGLVLLHALTALTQSYC
jgi:hypothetical protein